MGLWRSEIPKPQRMKDNQSPGASPGQRRSKWPEQRRCRGTESASAGRQTWRGLAPGPPPNLELWEETQGRWGQICTSKPGVVGLQRPKRTRVQMLVAWDGQVVALGS